MLNRNALALLGIAAATVLIGLVNAASADVLIGNWENLVTPPPPDPDPLPNFYRRPIGSSGTEGWVDFDNRSTYTSDTYGATNGTRSVKQVTADDGNTRYNQCLTIPLHSTGGVAALLSSGMFAIDVSWKHSDWVGGNWSQVENFCVNASGLTFTQVGRPTFDSARPDPADTFHGSWDAQNWGDNTRTLTWDISRYIDGNAANGELSVIPAPAGGGFANLVVVSNYDSAFDPSTAAFYFDNARFLPRVVNSEWTGTAPDPDADAGNGNAAINQWFASQNWTAGVPGVADSTVVFGNNNGAITAAQTVNTNFATAAGNITFNHAAGYAIAGTGSLTLDVSTGQAAVNVLSGSHTIQTPVVLADDTTITVTPAASTLSLTEQLTAAGRAITKEGAGVVQLSNVRAAAINLNAGNVRIAANGTNSGSSKVSSLNIAGSPSAWSATLDVTNNAAVVDYTGASPLAAIANQIKSGYAGGSWNGTGIISSTAASTTGRAVGYAEASAVFSVFPATFHGQSVDSTSLLIAYTIAGDANLDGSVNLADFTRLAAGFGTASSWSSGDFNYDAVTNLADFTTLAANFGSSITGDPLRSAAVPEPTTLGAAALLISATFRRRRRVPM